MSGLILIAGFTIALAISIGLTPVVRRLAYSYHLLDHPDIKPLGESGRRVHLRPVPRLGGFAIVMAFFVTFVAATQEFRIPAILLLSLLVFAIGAFDDVKPIGAGFRFVFQIFASSLAVYLGNLGLEKISISPSVSISLSPAMGLIVSTFIVVGAINALNMIDGLDGLAGGISVITLAMLSLLYYLASDDARLTMYLSIPAIGAILGFLLYNTHPASIFMGDNGSNWLGFMIGLHIVIVLSSDSLAWIDRTSNPVINATNVPLVSALLCFAVPIFDTAFVILRRILAGRHPMSADNRHFHHKLLRLGLTQTQSVTLIYFISIAGGILGLLPLAYPRYHFQWVPYVGLISIIIILISSVKVQWSGRYRNPFRSMLLNETGRYYWNNPLLNKTIHLWERINKYCIFLILAVTPAFAGTIPSAVGYAAIPFFFFTLILLLFNKTRNNFIESLVMTVSCIILLVANNHNSIQVEIMGNLHNIQNLYNVLFFFLFFSTVLFLLVTLKRNYLVLTPADFLLLALPLILILFPEDIKRQYRLDIISIRSFIIFLGYRALEKRRIYARRHLKMATLVALGYVIMAGIYQMRFVY